MRYCGCVPFIVSWPRSLAKIDEKSQILRSRVGQHEGAERFCRPLDRLRFRDLVLHHRLDSIVPRALEGRRHDVEGHEHRHARQDHVGWRRSKPHAERRMEKAMMNRGKLVTMIRMPGAIERIVSNPKVRMIHAAAEPSTGRFNKSAGDCCAKQSLGPGRKQSADEGANHSITKVLNKTLDTRPFDLRSTISVRSSLRYWKPRGPEFAGGALF